MSLEALHQSSLYDHPQFLSQDITEALSSNPGPSHGPHRAVRSIPKMKSFPDEIILHIISFLSPESSIWAVAQTSRRFYAICSPFLYRYNVVHGNNTAFAWAAKHGNMVTFQKALDAGAPLPASSGPGPTKYGPVINAYGKTIRERVYQDFPTHPASLAATGGHEAIVRFMFERGVNVDVRDREGFTVLALAAIHGHTSLVRFLLSQGAHQSISSHGNHYPIWLAAFHGHEGIVALLVANAKERWADGFIEQIQDGLWAAMIGVNWYYGSPNMPTLIFQVAIDGRADMVRLLLQLGADVNSGSLPPAARIRKPLMAAVRQGHHEVAEILLKRTPVIRTRALALCMTLGNHQMAGMLLNNDTFPEFHQEDIPEDGEDEDAEDWVQPLLLAVLEEGLDMVKMMLDKGANANLKCSNVPSWRSADPYRYVLFWAVELGHESWRDFHRKDSTEYLGNPAMVKLLLEKGADPNQVDIYGQPPLSYAIRAEDEILVQCLLDHGAKFDLAVD
ncbi:uncharacterized protein N7496_012249 [Penicillium cataractarum]|uniref:F-box domain-containing protein n=1 Tax=Penicillium cataractarum TaxID=2100454 RepID=A0A9W9R777_9EURO|nr:uncharacterized protein N7496_012249 [Penicillium cataractarum]KAJ5355037.1 hypothetical protein N7496_012249 [Penicillium cataractarum]